jgi:hypothetical protein
MANPTNNKKNHRTPNTKIPMKIHKTPQLNPPRHRPTTTKNNGKRENLWIKTRKNTKSSAEK